MRLKDLGRALKEAKECRHAAVKAKQSTDDKTASDAGWAKQREWTTAIRRRSPWMVDYIKKCLVGHDPCPPEEAEVEAAGSSARLRMTCDRWKDRVVLTAGGWTSGHFPGYLSADARLHARTVPQGRNSPAGAVRRG